MSDHGNVTAPGTVRLERALPGPIERVWAYLTDPEKRGRWFAGGTSSLTVGGTFTLAFDHARLSHERETPARWKGVEGHRSAARVTRCEPPRLLAYTWGEGDTQSEVTFELTPQGRNVLLVLTHRRLASRDGMVNVAGGWHVHVAILRAVLAGEEPPGLWSTLARVEAEYATRIPPCLLVRVTRRFATVAERVFDAFLDPAQAGRFLFATPAGTMVRARRGALSASYRALEGDRTQTWRESGGSGPVAEMAAKCGTDPWTYTRERPGMSAFVHEDGAVFHTYSTYARGLDDLWGMYKWLDRAPKGRNEPGIWWRRHDEYGEG